MRSGVRRNKRPRRKCSMESHNSFPFPWELCHSSCRQSIYMYQLYICLQEILRRYPDRGTCTSFTSWKPYISLTDFQHQRFWKTINRFSQTTDKELDLPYIYWIPTMHKIPINNDSLQVHRSIRPSLDLFFSQYCLHILSEVFRSGATQPGQEIESIRCGSLRIQKKN